MQCLLPAFAVLCALATSANAGVHAAADSAAGRASLPAPGPVGPHALVLWVPESDLQTYGRIAAAYNAHLGSEAPKLVVQVPTGGTFEDKVTAGVPRGRGPDLFVHAQDRVGGWVQAGKTLEPLDTLLGGETRAQFPKVALDAMTYRGSVYGLPLHFIVDALYFNRKLVPHPPRTTQQLAALAGKLTDPGTGRFGLAYDYANLFHHAALQNGFGGHAVNELLKVDLDLPQNARALELLVRWRDSFLPASAPSREELSRLFNEQRAAMVIEVPSFRDSISASVDFAVATLPSISEVNDRPMKPWVTVIGIFVAATSHRKDAAYSFAQFATSQAAQRMLLDDRRVPVNPAVLRDATAAAHAEVKAFFEQATAAEPLPSAPEMALVWGPGTWALEQVLQKRMSPADAVRVAQIRATAPTCLRPKR